mgnify:CR=1 FL=1
MIFSLNLIKFPFLNERKGENRNFGINNRNRNYDHCELESFFTQFSEFLRSKKYPHSQIFNIFS